MAETDILLSTYNGEQFLNEQLVSIAAQSYSDWRLLVRDDSSSDRSLTILKLFAQSMPDKKVLIFQADENSGPAESYAELLSFSSAPYVLFADQDDIWLPEKITVLKEAMNELELKFGRNIPLLVYSDMKVVNQNLQSVAESFFAYNALPTEINNLSQLFFFNNIPGCTMLVNRALIDFAMPFPEEVIMHDWWLNLSVNVAGHFHFVNRPLLLYRYHSSNFYGTGKFNIKKYFNIKEYKNNLLRMIGQISAFEERYAGLIDDESIRNALFQLKNISRYNCLKRKYTLFKYAGVPGKKMRKISMLIFG
jgi:glycosyltransferase involved in cell wall biosynthesis